MLKRFFQDTQESSLNKEDLFAKIQQIAQTSPPNIAAILVPISSEGEAVASYFKRYEGERYKIVQKDFRDFSVFKIRKDVVYSGESRTVEGFLATYEDGGYQYLFAANTDIEQSLDFSDFLEHIVFNGSTVSTLLFQ